MSIFNSFDISASGMTAQRFRTDIIMQNIANATTTRTEDGTPYRRRIVTFEEKENTNVLLFSERENIFDCILDCEGYNFFLASKYFILFSFGIKQDASTHRISLATQS